MAKRPLPEAPVIRVTIDLVPFGDEARTTTLHTIEIWNDLRDHIASRGQFGSYGYRISRKRGKHAKRAHWSKSGDIRGYPRTRLNAVRLVQRVPNNAYPEGR